MKTPPLFAYAVKALNGEGEFSPISKPSGRIDLVRGSGDSTICRFGDDFVRPYWMWLREGAHFTREHRPNYRIPHEAVYRKAQATFVRTLRNLVETLREENWNLASSFLTRPKIKRVIEGFARRHPLAFLATDVNNPSFIGSRGGRDRPIKRAHLEAISLFVELARSSNRHRLGTCLRCKRFFFGRPDQKCCPRPRRCGSYLAAIEATKRRWKSQRDERLRRAQAACAAWERMQPGIGWKQWVADHTGLSMKFLTRAEGTGELSTPKAAKGEGNETTRRI